MASVTGTIRLEVCGVSLAGSREDLPDGHDQSTGADLWLDNNILTPEQQSKAEALVRHVNEVLTGFSGGEFAPRLDDEPKPQYDLTKTTKTQRAKAKATELRVEERTIWKYLSQYASDGIAGLVDRRSTSPKAGVKLDPKVEEAIREEAIEQASGSDVSNNTLRWRVRNRLLDEHGPDAAELLPPRSTFNKAVQQLLRREGTQRLPAQSRRTKLAPVDDEFGYLEAERPGEFVAIDSTGLDVLAFDPATNKSGRVDFHAAIDVYSRQIVGFCVTPRGILGADLALLLADVVAPAIDDSRWPSAERRPFVGSPTHLILKAFDLPDDSDLQAKMPVKPGTVIVDRENIYQSVVLRDACRQLRTNIQPARPTKGSDKPWIERFFGTMNTRLLQKLPGYAGSSVANRGTDIEGKATLSIPDLEAAIGEWIVGDYHECPHGGLRYEHDLSRKVSPNEAFRIGLETAGFLHIPRDPHLRLKLLPTEWRRFREEGVKFRNLIYDGKNLPRRVRETDGNYGPRWPIKYDPRDLRRIWFLDEETGEWIEIPWRYLRSVTKPFNHVALDLAKKKAREGKGREPTEQEIEDRLWDVMDQIERDIVGPSKDRKQVRSRMRLKDTRDRKPSPERSIEPELLPDDIDNATWPRSPSLTSTLAEIPIPYSSPSISVTKHRTSRKSTYVLTVLFIFHLLPPVACGPIGGR